MSESRHINIPVFIPHRGCPHTCVFCDQKKISGMRQHQSAENVKRILEESLSTVGADDFVEIAFFGGSFTGIPETEMVSYLEIAKPYIMEGRVKGIRLSTRPDTISMRVLDILEKYHVSVIELGVQSLDDEILKNSQRGHSSEDVKTACHRIKERGIKLGIQTMLGLPGDTLEKATGTAYGVIDLKPDMVRIYPVVVLEGTYLEAMYEKGKYSPLSLDEAVEWCARVLPLYRQAGITILRMGLHSSDSLESAIVAGPYHPAFGELVESRILYGRLVSELDSLKPLNGSRITIRTRPDMVSKLIGHKKSNMEAIKKRYSLQDIVIQADLSEGEFIIGTIS